MRGNWIKIVFFILAAVMLAGIAQVLLDPGLGAPDEARRSKHPAGFSFIAPLGWGASVFYAASPTGEDVMRISPEHSTGRQPYIFVSKLHVNPGTEENTVPYTFQGQPARLLIQKMKSAWAWRLTFERQGSYFHLGIEFPVPLEVEKSPLWPFLQSFKVEPVFKMDEATSATAPVIEMPTAPTTAPTAKPATEPAQR